VSGYFAIPFCDKRQDEIAVGAQTVDKIGFGGR
jgi:hypothetical protein